jgi:phosphohistidine swiveling domain-containing protein
MKGGFARTLVFIGSALACTHASAFPLLIAGAGAGVLGALFLPAAVALVIAWATFTGPPGRLRTTGLVLLSALAAAFATYNLVTPPWNKQVIEKMANGADVEPFKVNVRFEYLDNEKQASLKQAMGPDDFVSGYLEGRYTVIWLDKARHSVFKDYGQRYALEDVSENPTRLIDAIQASSKPVVLVDETGALASSVARDIGSHFGVKTQFLLGGTSGLNTVLWRNWAIESDPQGVSFDSWKASATDVPGLRIASLAVLDEYLSDGWQHGDVVTTMAGYLAGIDEVAMQLRGHPVLISGAENTFSGHTWLLVRKLRAMGIDVTYILPTRTEKLVKQPYIAPYPGSSTLLPLSEAMLMADLLGGVTMLDLRRNEDVRSQDESYGTVIRLGMDAVAKGELDGKVGALDLSQRFMGIAFDQRTLYHALLTGEAVSRLGGRWLGVAIHPGAYDQDFEPLSFTDSPWTYSTSVLKAWAVLAGAALVGSQLESSVLIVVLVGLLVGVSHLIPGRALRWTVFIVLALVLQSVCLAESWLMPQPYSSPKMVLAFCLAYSLGLGLARYFGRHLNRFGADSDLPQKIGLLLRAKKLGFNVPGMLVLTRERFEKLSAEPFVSECGHLVRSAARDESAGSSSTGIFESICVPEGSNVWPAAKRVLDMIGLIEREPHCFIQPLIKDAAFGVVMFGTGPDAHLILGECGEGNNITAGKGRADAIALPVWEANEAAGFWRKPVRALMSLSSSLGATGIEFALSRNGRLHLLQVVVDECGRSVLPVLTRFANQRGMFDELAHDSAADAAVYAAFAMPGEQVAIAGHRLILERSFFSAMQQMVIDGRAVLGRFAPFMLICLPGAEVENRFNRLDRVRVALANASKPDLTASDAELIAYLSSEVEQVQQLYGRFSRLTTLASEVSAVELGPPVDEALTRVKQACSETFKRELIRLQPVIRELEKRAAVDQLLKALGTSLGVHMSEAAHVAACRPNMVIEIHELFSGLAPKDAANVSWGVPPVGLLVNLRRPASFKAGDALLISDTDISHLPMLRTASAVVATSGSTLSHLMQHARRLRVPYIVGASAECELADGSSAMLKPNGEVFRA